MDQWLIRTEQNQITGPFPKEKVKEMIIAGQLGVQDEVCEANSYWFAIHEKEELAKSFGIEIQKSEASKELDLESASWGVEATDPGISNFNVESLNAQPQPEAATSVLDLSQLMIKPAEKPVSKSVGGPVQKSQPLVRAPAVKGVSTVPRSKGKGTAGKVILLIVLGLAGVLIALGVIKVS